MASQNGPSEFIKMLISSKGGRFWPHSTDIAAGGTGVARTEIENYRVPDSARTLLGWRPLDYPNTAAVAESQIAVFDISGSNYKYQPQEVICGNTSDSYLSVGLNAAAASEWYPVYAPVSGGESISAGIEPCDAIAGNRRAGVEFTWCNVRLPELMPIYSLCSREVATGTTVVSNAGTSLNINNAHQLIEAGGIATHAAITAAEELLAQLRLKCTVWDPVQDILITFEPSQAAGTTSGSPTTRLARRACDLQFLSDRATVTAELDQDGTLTAAGQFVHYIRWI